MEEFGIVDEKCYFCGHEKTVRFKEYYTFCPCCSAISVNLIAMDTCMHFTNNAVVAVRQPWFVSVRKDLLDKEIPYIIESVIGGHCSICGKYCEVDGS